VQSKSVGTCAATPPKMFVSLGCSISIGRESGIFHNLHYWFWISVRSASSRTAIVSTLPVPWITMTSFPKPSGLSKAGPWTSPTSIAFPLPNRTSRICPHLLSSEFHCPSGKV
jgi:hypothetical protein